MPAHRRPPGPDSQPDAPHDRPVDRQQVAKLLDSLERDLDRAKLDEAGRRRLRGEIEAIRKLLGSGQPEPAKVRERLHGIRQTLSSGEMFRDALYLSEIARILGMP